MPRKTSPLTRGVTAESVSSTQTGLLRESNSANGPSETIFTNKPGYSPGPSVAITVGMIGIIPRNGFGEEPAGWLSVMAGVF